MPSVLMLSIVMLNDLMLSVIELNVVASYVDIGVPVGLYHLPTKNTSKG